MISNFLDNLRQPFALTKEIWKSEKKSLTVIENILTIS